MRFVAQLVGAAAQADLSGLEHVDVARGDGSDFARWLNPQLRRSIRGTLDTLGTEMGEAMAFGPIDPRVVAAARARGVQIGRHDLTVSRAELRHLLRGDKHARGQAIDFRRNWDPTW